MSDELERLRADLEVLKKYNSGNFVSSEVNKLKVKIARLEAEAANPWREAKKDLAYIVKVLDWKSVGDYVDHLTAENARLTKRVAELEAENKAEDDADLADAEAVLKGNPAWTNFEEAIGHHWVSDVNPIAATQPPSETAWVESELAQLVDAGSDEPGPLEPDRVLATAAIEFDRRGILITSMFRKYADEFKPYRLKGTGE